MNTDNKTALYVNTFLILTLCFGAIVFFAMGGCTDAAETRRVVEAAGLTDVQPGGYAYFACGEGDSVHTKFTAKNSKGQRVEGVVCCGLVFKACTVRY